MRSGFSKPLLEQDLQAGSTVRWLPNSFMGVTPKVWVCEVGWWVQRSANPAVEFCWLIRQGRGGRRKSPGCLPVLAAGTGGATEVPEGPVMRVMKPIWGACKIGLILSPIQYTFLLTYYVPETVLRHVLCAQGAWRKEQHKREDYENNDNSSHSSKVLISIICGQPVLYYPNSHDFCRQVQEF